MVKISTEVREYEVESLLAMRKINGKAYYLVKWTGYDEDDATWEPLSHLTNSISLVREFNEKAGNHYPNLHKVSPNGLNSRLSETILEEWFCTNEQVEGRQKPGKILTHSRSESGELQFEVQWRHQPRSSLVKLKEMERDNPKELIDYFARIA